MKNGLVGLGLLLAAIGTCVCAQEDAVRKAMVNWDAGRDFAAGYFDVFYENGLLFALPSVYANKLQDVMVANPEQLRACSRSGSVDLRKLVQIKEEHVERTGRDVAPLYRDGKEIGRLNEVQIDGQGGWRLLTLREAMGSPLLARWQQGFCLQIKSPYGSNSSFVSNVNVLTYTPGGTKKGGGWPVLSVGRTARVSGDRLNWQAEEYSSKIAPLVLVRALSPIEREIWNAPGVDAGGRVARYASLLSERAAQPERKKVEKPGLAELPSQPVVSKDEFETTAAFEQRKQREQDAWRTRSRQIEQSNAARLLEYDQQMNAAEQVYRTQLAQANSDAGKARAYQDALSQAVSAVLGKPYFRDLRYDADTQQMHGVVFSARMPEFARPVVFPVPLAQARSFKDDLLENKLVPQVQIDQGLNVLAVNAVSNDKKIALDFESAKGQSTVKGYQDFMAKYPQAPQIKAAMAGIAKLQEQDRLAELKRQQDAAEREKRQSAQSKAEKLAYQGRKNVGEQVCRPARLALGLVNITMRAFVERVEGERMQLRIGSTEGQASVYYNGVPLENGTLIWDRFDEWKVCR